MICRGCGGVLGRDCFNGPECEWISQQMAADAAVERALYEREYAAYAREQQETYEIEMEAEFEGDKFEATAAGVA